MTEPTVQSEIARALSRAHPPVIMTLEDVAAFTGHAYSYVRNELQNTPGFPPQLTRFKHPRWSREDVLRWAGVSG